MIMLLEVGYSSTMEYLYALCRFPV